MVQTLWSRMVWWLLAYVEARCLNIAWSGVAETPVSSGFPWIEIWSDSCVLCVPCYLVVIVGIGRDHRPVMEVC